jgi:hypothetical protein
MASATKKLRNIRKRKTRAQGKRRKRMLRNKGTTPPFPIHVPQDAESRSEGSTADS